MEGMIQRYNPDFHGETMEEDPEGDWVKVNDVIGIIEGERAKTHDESRDYDELVQMYREALDELNAMKRRNSQ